MKPFKWFGLFVIILPVKKIPEKFFPGRGNRPLLSSYVKNISLVMVLLAMTAAGIATRLESYRLPFAVGAVVFMALNALAAIYPLYRFKGKNPFNIYLLGMTIRLAIIGVVLISLVVAGGLSQNSLLGIALTGMISFVAYLAVEVRHLLRFNTSLLSH